MTWCGCGCGGLWGIMTRDNIWCVIKGETDHYEYVSQHDARLSAGKFGHESAYYFGVLTTPTRELALIVSEVSAVITVVKLSAAFKMATVMRNIRSKNTVS